MLRSWESRWFSCYTLFWAVCLVFLCCCGTILLILIEIETLSFALSILLSTYGWLRPMIKYGSPSSLLPDLDLDLSLSYLIRCKTRSRSLPRWFLNEMRRVLMPLAMLLLLFDRDRDRRRRIEMSLSEEWRVSENLYYNPPSGSGLVCLLDC